MSRKDYIPRKQVNEQSKNAATKDRELWSQDEIDFLEAFWTVEVKELEALAAVLGRTVEACRQKHYEIQKGDAKAVAEKSLKKVDNWSRGFTSLAEMGF